MPEQQSIFLLRGTIGGLTYYKMKGKYLVRSKTSLTKQRVQKDPAFANSRASSSLFGRAAAIASAVYRELPAHRRKHGLIGKLTGVANKLLHEGMDEAAIRERLQRV